MADLTTTIPLTGTSFPLSEYQCRRDKILEAVERAELDALLVTAHVHLEYISGYNGMGGYFAPFPLILVPGRSPVFIVREYEVEAVLAESCVSEVFSYTQEKDFARVCGEILRRLGVQAGKVGFELGCWNLAPADLMALQAQLPEMKVVDATRIVPTAAAVLTELELEAMRASMATTDLAVRTFQNSLTDGVTELEVYAAIKKQVKEAGGELNDFCSLTFGDRVRLAHGAPATYPLHRNQPAVIEVGGASRNYSAGLVRAGVLGRNPEAESIYELSLEALEAAIAAIKPGVTAGSVDAAARNVVMRAGRHRAFRHRAGYQTGLRWSERGGLSLEPESDQIVLAGMTLHMPMFLFSETGYIFGVSEQVLVTESGAEVLSSTPRSLHFA